MGLLTDNLALGIAFGVSIGTGVGIAFDKGK